MRYVSASGMKRKAPGAQKPEPMGISEDFEHRVTQRFGRAAIHTAF